MSSLTLIVGLAFLLVDDYLLALAIEAHAHYLVTGDQDLLVLQEIGTCRIIDAATFERTI